MFVEIQKSLEELHNTSVSGTKTQSLVELHNINGSGTTNTKCNGTTQLKY